ncbi:hypothetical protein SDC9_102566 [bioreactor metagenome]|uniref:Uncharacterized protein n=1 Tax=bioreactor metagenome TaxID=1076179 RepID=A0A645ARS7_9ZZZZ
MDRLHAENIRNRSGNPGRIGFHSVSQGVEAGGRSHFRRKRQRQLRIAQRDIRRNIAAADREFDVVLQIG